MADQREIVAELYKRMDSLPAEKQSVVRELAKRFNLIPGTTAGAGRTGARLKGEQKAEPWWATGATATMLGGPILGEAAGLLPLAARRTGGTLPESGPVSRLQTIKEGISAERAAQPKGILKPTATVKGAVKGAMAERPPAPPSRAFQRVTETEVPQHTPEFEAAAARSKTEPGKGTKTKFGGRFEQKYGKPNPMPPARRARIEQFVPKPGEAKEGAESGDIYKQHGQKRGGEIERASIAKDANLGRFLKQKGFTKQMLRDMKPDQWKIVMREINKAYGVDYRYTPGTASRIDEIAKFLPE